MSDAALRRLLDRFLDWRYYGREYRLARLRGQSQYIPPPRSAAVAANQGYGPNLGLGASEAKDSSAAIAWERFDYDGGLTIWQRECPDCDGGLLLAPVRNCPRCDGSGYLTTEVDPSV